MGLKAFLKLREEGVPARKAEKRDTSTKLASFLKRSSSFSMIYKVVGVTFENRQRVLKKYFEENQRSGKVFQCELILDDNNPYDKNAVAVYICGDTPEQIGFLSKEENVSARENFSYIKDVYVEKFGMTTDGIIGVSIKIIYEE